MRKCTVFEKKEGIIFLLPLWDFRTCRWFVAWRASDCRLSSFCWLIMIEPDFVTRHDVVDVFSFSIFKFFQHCVTPIRTSKYLLSSTVGYPSSTNFLTCKYSYRVVFMAVDPIFRVAFNSRYVICGSSVNSLRVAATFSSVTEVCGRPAWYTSSTDWRPILNFLNQLSTFALKGLYRIGF